MWYPDNDAKAFMELHRKGRLTFGEWMASLLHRQVLPYFRWYDPAPSAVSAARLLKRLGSHAAHRGRPAVDARTGG
jgi:hypothetical protein